MGKRGPAPTPTEKLRKRGSPLAARNTKRGEPKVKPATDVPKCPARLTGNARRIWKSVGEILVGMKVLADGDLNTLERYAETLADYWRVKAKIKTYNTKARVFDADIERQHQIILRDFNTILTKLEHEFGLTPSARTRVSEAPPKSDAATGSAKPAAGGKGGFQDRTFPLPSARGA